MKATLILIISLFTFVLTSGTILACNHDILCADGWVWSDDEGTCVEAESGTS